MGMPANGDGLGPAGDQAGDVLTDDGLPEDSSPKDVPDRSIGTLPHLLQLELCGGQRRSEPRAAPAISSLGKAEGTGGLELENPAASFPLCLQEAGRDDTASFPPPLQELPASLIFLMAMSQNLPSRVAPNL